MVRRQRMRRFGSPAALPRESPATVQKLIAPRFAPGPTRSSNGRMTGCNVESDGHASPGAAARPHWGPSETPLLQINVDVKRVDGWYTKWEDFDAAQFGNVSGKFADERGQLRLLD
jgi:hypothetical protein